MRTHDRAVPTIGGEHPGPDSPLGRWPVDLFIGIERLPFWAYEWDDGNAAWDDPGGAFAWDDLEQWPYDRIDATCDWQGLEITTGTPEPDGPVQAGGVVLSLDNRTGEWSQYDQTGRLTSYGPGCRLDVWAVVDGAPWWLYSGRVTVWTEDVQRQAVEITAYDEFSELSQDIGPWTPGSAGQTVAARLGAILDLIANTAPRRFDVGDVTLVSFASTATPLAEAQAVATSDGGVFHVDADGTLVYRNRQWTAGRDDQSTVRVFSDNVCAEGITNVWDPGLVTDDSAVVNKVRLQNLAGLVSTATDPTSIGRYGTQTLPERTKDQWSTQAQGDTLAAFLVARGADAYLRIETFSLYLHDPRQNLWAAGIDMRLGDIVRFPRDQATPYGPARIDLNLVVRAIRHQITPEGWVTTFLTSRAVGDNTIYRWDSDDAWDSDPPAVWGY